jgi:hypothetical protein
MPKVRRRNWTETPDCADYEAAADYLSLLLPTETAQLAVVRLRNGPMVFRRAKDLLRASGLADLPAENPSIARKPKEHTRKLLSPVLCVRGDLQVGALLTIADGYHRICANYLVDEGTDILCRLTELPWPDETLAAAVSAQRDDPR